MFKGNFNKKVTAFMKAVGDKCEKALLSPRFPMMLLLLFMVSSVFAQDMTAGNNAFGSVTTTIRSYVPLVQQLCYAIAAVVAVVGAISVYIKMNNEEQDVKKSIMMIVGACIFLVAAAQALPLFFGADESATPAP